MVACGGDSPILRLWDAHKERRRCDLNTGSTSYVSTMAFSTRNSDLVCAGFGDGSVRIFDIRVSTSGGGGMASGASSASLSGMSGSGVGVGKSSAVLTYNAQHTARVLDCQVQDQGGFAGKIINP